MNSEIRESRHPEPLRWWEGVSESRYPEPFVDPRREPREDIIPWFLTDEEKEEYKQKLKKERDKKILHNTWALAQVKTKSGKYLPMDNIRGILEYSSEWRDNRKRATPKATLNIPPSKKSKTKKKPRTQSRKQSRMKSRKRRLSRL